MAGGDAAALLAFAAIGRINHGGVLDLETLATAAPFWAGERPCVLFLCYHGTVDGACYMYLLRCYMDRILPTTSLHTTTTLIPCTTDAHNSLHVSFSAVA